MPRTQHAAIRRANSILEMLSDRDHVSTTELVDTLGVSAVTIRKDLDALEAQGLLQRIHGGAIPIAPMHSGYTPMSQSYNESEKINRQQKLAIARAAAARVSDGDVLAFTGGTTATFTARSISNATNITVITNAVNIALEMSHQSGVTIFVPGGFLRGGMYSLVSVTALDRIRNFTIDKMFVGVNGIHPERGLTELLNDQALVHRTLMEQSRQVIAIADSSKLGRIYRAFLCDVTDVDLLITDAGADPDWVRSLEQNNLHVQLVSVPEELHPAT